MQDAPKSSVKQLSFHSECPFKFFFLHRMCNGRNGREIHAFAILKMKFLRTLQMYWVTITCSVHCYTCGVYLSFIRGENSDIKRKKVI